MFILNNERISDISLELAGKIPSLKENLKDCSINNRFFNLELYFPDSEFCFTLIASYVKLMTFLVTCCHRAAGLV